MLWNASIHFKNYFVTNYLKYGMLIFFYLGMPLVHGPANTMDTC